jgi:hypothetical protein
MKTVPFNPRNKKHLKGLQKYFDRILKKYGKEPDRYLVVSPDWFKGLDYNVSDSVLKNGLIWEDKDVT